MDPSAQLPCLPAPPNNLESLGTQCAHEEPQLVCNNDRI